jgi:predicted DNA-binding transcriptional regulator YafY
MKNLMLTEEERAAIIAELEARENLNLKEMSDEDVVALIQRGQKVLSPERREGILRTIK